MKHGWMVLVFLVVLAAFIAGPRASVAGPDQGSEFTGEAKAVLYVSDVERSVPFFGDVLGFEFLGFTEAEGSPYYAEMAAGSFKFGLHNPMNAEQENWVGHQRIYFRVTAVEPHRSLVAERGGSPGELIETDWMDMFIVRDLDGHQIVFAETDASRHTIDPW